MPSGGELVVESLAAQGVDRIFCVPGESYLAVLDALVGSGIELINARHEGGAALMAETDGKLLGRPGVAMVTRGPGATNAAHGVHVAQQDSTPMVLLVGQIARGQRGRDAFQEVDYVQTFSHMAKWVAEIDEAARVPEFLARAWHTAMSGRPGPVVLVLPEDMLRDEVVAPATAQRVEIADPAPAKGSITELNTLLKAASNPLLILGGSRFTPADSQALATIAAHADIPVSCSFRRQSLLDNHHSTYAGDLGLGANPALLDRVRQSDLLILLGGRLSEIPSQGYSLIDIPHPTQKLVHIHTGAEELGRVYTPTLAINASPKEFLQAWENDLPTAVSADAAGARTRTAHNSYLQWSESPAASAGDIQMGHVITRLREAMPQDTVYCNGAGNYAGWLHRFMRYRPGTQLAPTSGSMGYGLPAAIAAKLRHPEREVVCLAGDGCLQMTVQELGTALQHGAALRVIVADNGLYGTIRMHQARDYPGRVSGTTLVNPDFAALARAYGATAETVKTNGEFDAAFERMREAPGLSLIHLLLDPEAITPTTTLAALEASAAD